MDNDERPDPAVVPPPAPPGTESPAESGLSARQKAWLGMAAVAVALVLLTMIPALEPADPNAPPPPADGGASASAGEEGDGNLIGTPAPLHFTLKDMNDIDVKLASFKGKVIVFNFWATWCGPCRVEIPYLIELQRQYADDLVILGVSVDDPAEKLKPYATEMKINYPLLVGNGRQDFQDAFGPFWGIPVTVFVARDGRIYKKHSGIASKEQFEHEIASLL